MDQIKVGKFISVLRHDRGMTQEQLGERLGVTGRTVSRWENGNYMPDIDRLLELSELLGVSVTELLTGERLDTPERTAEKAEENLISALSESDTFGLSDRVEYFKRKWLTEHRFDIALTLIVCIAAAAALALWARPLFPGGSAVLAIGAWCVLRNRMMAYVESRAFKK